MRPTLAIPLVLCLGCVPANAPNVEPPPDYCTGAGEALVLADEPVGAYTLGTAEDLVRVTAPGGARWAHVAAPIAPAARVRLLALLRAETHDASCANMIVVPFADDNRAVVFTTAFVRVVRFSPWRVRELDQMGAMLESCHMDERADELVCSLDLTWGQARFDADGEDTSGTFSPRWR